MWIAAYVVGGWLVASVVVGGLFAILFAGAKRGDARGVRSRDADMSIDLIAAETGSSRHHSVPTGWPDGDEPAPSTPSTHAAA
jgi:hypothetical protein